MNLFLVYKIYKRPDGTFQPGFDDKLANINCPFY